MVLLVTLDSLFLHSHPLRRRRSKVSWAAWRRLADVTPPRLAAAAFRGLSALSGATLALVCHGCALWRWCLCVYTSSAWPHWLVWWHSVMCEFVHLCVKVCVSNCNCCKCYLLMDYEKCNWGERSF